MSPNILYIKKILSKIRNGENISYSEFLEFHGINCAIIKSYLTTLKRSLLNIMLKLDYTLDDLVGLCLEKIYERNIKNQFVRLQDFVAKFQDKLDDILGGELFLIYKGFLIRLADNELAKQYAMADPIGAKIHRNLVAYLKNSPKLKLIKDYRGCVVSLKNGDSDEYLEKFPIELLEKEMLNRLNHRNTNTPYLMDILHSIFVEHKIYRTSVPLIDLVQIFKKIQSYEIVVETDYPVFDCDGLTQYDIDRIREDVELIIKQKLIFTYYYQGKLNLEEVQAFIKAFGDMFHDLCSNFEQCESLYKYLETYLPIDEKQYEIKYKSKMEYLKKIAIEEFKKHLMKEL